MSSIDAYGWPKARIGEQDAADVPVYRDQPPLLTAEQIGDAVEAMFGDWSYDDPEWWRDACEAVRSHGLIWLDPSPALPVERADEEGEKP